MRRPLQQQDVIKQTFVIVRPGGGRVPSGRVQMQRLRPGVQRPVDPGQALESARRRAPVSVSLRPQLQTPEALAEAPIAAAQHDYKRKRR